MQQSAALSSLLVLLTALTAGAGVRAAEGGGPWAISLAQAGLPRPDALRFEDIAAGMDARGQDGAVEVGGIRARVGDVFDRFEPLEGAGVAFAPTDYARSDDAGHDVRFDLALEGGGPAERTSRVAYVYVDLDRRAGRDWSGRF